MLSAIRRVVGSEKLVACKQRQILGFRKMFHGNDYTKFSVCSFLRASFLTCQICYMQGGKGAKAVH